VTCGAIMAQKRARDQRARPKGENGDPKAAIPYFA
jgi:hypothetical protein